MRRKRQVRFEQALELQKGLIVKNNVIEIFEASAPLVKTELQGIAGEARIVLFPGESFFLSGGNDLPILYKRGGTIVIKSGYSENLH